VRQGGPADAVGDGLQIFLPVAGNGPHVWIGVELVDDGLDDPVQQFFPIVEKASQRALVCTPRWLLILRDVKPRSPF